MDVQNVPPIVKENLGNRSILLGLANNSNLYLFNSVVQALFLLPSFQDHVKTSLLTGLSVSKLSRITIQSNTNKEEKTLIKQLKKLYQG